MTDYSLKFDGYKLSLIGDGKEVRSWDAVSGVAGFQSPDNQGLKNTGPIPEGSWTFNTSAIQTITVQDNVVGSLSKAASLLLAGSDSVKFGTWYGGDIAWGLERVFLAPSGDTNTLGRDKFSIHGGDQYGSAGCIDLGHDEIDFFRTLTENGISNISLNVSYDPRLLTEAHPLAGQNAFTRNEVSVKDHLGNSISIRRGGENTTVAVPADEFSELAGHPFDPASAADLGQLLEALNEGRIQANKGYVAGNDPLTTPFTTESGEQIVISNNSTTWFASMIRNREIERAVQNNDDGSRVDSEYDWQGVLRMQEEVAAAGNSLVKLYDTQNKRPETEAQISRDTAGKIVGTNVTLDEVIVAAGGSVGQVLGSAIGRAIAGNNQFAQLAAGTVAGAIGQKLATAISSSLVTNAASMAVTDVFAGFGLDLLGAAGGSIASFLTAEIGTALGLDGFGEQLFTAAVGGYFGSVINTVAHKGFGVLGTGLVWTEALNGAAASVGGLLGSVLGQQLVHAETQAGAIGGQLAGAIGSAIGIALAQGLGLALNFIIPGIGSLIGTIIGTLLGDLFGSTSHPSAVHTVDPGQTLYASTFSAVSASDGGDPTISKQMADGVAAIVNSYLTAVHGIGIGQAKQIVIGYQTENTDVPYIVGPATDRQYFFTGNDAVNAAAMDLLHHTEAVGGDLLVKRAHQHSVYSDVLTLGGDLQIAQDYERYLDNMQVINALMAANPASAFTAGWAATFARVNDLGLNQYGVSDFLGGLAGFLDSAKQAGLAAASSVSVKRGDNGSVIIELRVARNVNIPGQLSVYASQTNEIDDDTGKTVQFVFNDGLAAGGFHALAAGQLTGDTGNDLWFGGDSANNFNAVTGSGNDILVSGASDDLIHAGEGGDFVDGGAGNDQLFGETGSDLLRGGAGFDNLQGGAGDDTYLFNRGDGADSVLDTYSADILIPPDPTAPPSQPVIQFTHLNGGADSLTFGPGISATDVVVQLSGVNLIVGVRNPANPNVPFEQLADRITLQNWTDLLDRIETFRFADGSTVNVTTLVNTGTGGDDVFGGMGGANAIDGGTGNDSMSYAASATAVAIGLGGGAGLGGDAQGDTLINVENLTGSNFNDSLTGDAYANTLIGGSGNDALNGGAGADVMIGGVGDDSYLVDNLGDVVSENPGEGFDTVYSSVSTTLGVNIENLFLIGSASINGSGNAVANFIGGNAGDNILSGGGGGDSLDSQAGNDTLDGGTGADSMEGGLGDDTYIVDDAGDVVVENVGAGVDTVYSSISTTLSANVDNLTLIGATAINGTGNATNNIIIGNNGDNVLAGADGADTLYSGAGNDVLDGGTGADNMIGDTGDDAYFVDNAADVVTENAGEGTDTVSAQFNYTLSNNIENLTLTGAATSGTGNAGDNTITGNNLDNTLAGGGGNDTLDGGTGADAMIGGTGDDTYIVDDVSDYAVENAGEGFDTVRSSLSYALGQNTEGLTLTGSDAIDGFGSTDNNLMIGNSGDNNLFGAEGADTLFGGAGNDTLDGGPGADVMFGGLGDDRYVVDDDDLVTENAGEGTDTVYSSISYSLVPNVENLTLTDIDAIDGFGNAENNVMTGNAGDNSLFGAEGADTLLGGAGNDTLDGGPGADTMLGGVGDDKYGVDSADDVVTENADEGTDVVFASISYTLGANVENLRLTDIDVISGTGNALDNVITGSDGNNILTGLGGSDTLVGGAGTDTAVYSGHRADYAVSWNIETQSLAITDQRSNSPDGSDTANSIEILQFADGSAEYDAQGRLTRSTLIGGDGSRAVTNYDADGTQPWSVQLLNYDSTGNLRTFSQNEDDGTLAVTQYDVDQNRTWESYTSTFNNDGRLTAVNVAYDDTTSLVTNYDITDIASWSSQTGAGGPGTVSINIVDSGDAFEWANYTNVVSSGGSLLSQAGTLDNEGHWLNAYDTSAAFSWTSYFNAYNTNGQLTWQSGNQDNGTHWLTVFDTSGTASWSQATVAFDADYNQMAIGGINDDGSHLIATSEFNASIDLLGWSPFAYIPTQHLWPQAQIWGAAVAENAAAGTLVGTVAGSSLEGDGGTVLNFAMTNDAGGRFVIDAGTGVVTVANGAQFNYESTAFHTIQVRTTDASGEVSDKTFTVTVTNVNEAPINAALIGGTVEENADNGTVVGTVLGIDQDAGSTFSYSLTNNASGRFAINATTGVVTVANGAQLNYEAAT